MPIYEFECTECGDVFERLQKLSDADPVDCPECGKPRVKRRLTAPAFRLSGTGWYETDFKKEGDKQRNLTGKDEAPVADAKADSKSESKADPKPDSKSDSKPEAKPEPRPTAKEPAKAAPAPAPVTKPGSKDG